MKIIGLMGGVGSGKSTVAKLMEEKFGCYLLPADDFGRLCMQKGQDVYKKIVDYFGTDILKEDGELDRKKLSDLAFTEKAVLEKLNSMIHPFVKQEIEKKLERIKKDGLYSYVMIESAILIEAGYESICDEIWYVFVPEQVRIERLKCSRGYSDATISHIMKNQMTEKEYRLHGVKVIDNHCELEKVIEQIEILLV